MAIERLPNVALGTFLVQYIRAIQTQEKVIFPNFMLYYECNLLDEVSLVEQS